MVSWIHMYANIFRTKFFSQNLHSIYSLFCDLNWRIPLLRRNVLKEPKLTSKINNLHRKCMAFLYTTFGKKIFCSNRFYLFFVSFFCALLYSFSLIVYIFCMDVCEFFFQSSSLCALNRIFVVWYTVWTELTLPKRKLLLWIYALRIRPRFAFLIEWKTRQKNGTLETV